LESDFLYVFSIISPPVGSHIIGHTFLVCSATKTVISFIVLNETDKQLFVNWCPYFSTLYQI